MKPWGIVTFTTLACGIPQMLNLGHAGYALGAWLGAASAYVVLLRMFGRRFVIHGAILAILMSIDMAIVLHQVTTIP